MNIDQEFKALVDLYSNQTFDVCIESETFLGIPVKNKSGPSSKKELIFTKEKIYSIDAFLPVYNLENHNAIAIPLISRITHFGPDGNLYGATLPIGSDEYQRVLKNMDFPVNIGRVRTSVNDQGDNFAGLFYLVNNNTRKNLTDNIKRKEIVDLFYE